MGKILSILSFVQGTFVTLATKKNVKKLRLFNQWKSSRVKWPIQYLPIRVNTQVHECSVNLFSISLEKHVQSHLKLKRRGGIFATNLGDKFEYSRVQSWTSIGKIRKIPNNDPAFLIGRGFHLFVRKNINHGHRFLCLTFLLNFLVSHNYSIQVTKGSDEACYMPSYADCGLTHKIMQWKINRVFRFLCSLK